MTNRFDPDPNQPYGRTAGGEVLQTEEDMRKLLQNGEGPGFVKNPSRPDRIENEGWRILEGHLEEAIEEILSLVDREEITVEEAKDAYYANSNMGDYIFEDYLEGYDE